MTVTASTVSVPIAAVATAPLIEGATPTTFGTNLSGVGFSNPARTGRIGCRVALSATTNFTTHRFIAFQLATTSYGISGGGLTSVATGGMRIIFIDSLGAYAGYNIYGGDIPDYAESLDGFWGSFRDVGSVSANAWHISPSRTPDISGGTINWAAIVAVEFSYNLNGTQTPDLYIGALYKVDGINVTGTETLASVRAAVGVSACDPQLMLRSPYNLQSVSGVVYAGKTNLTIGDGATATAFSDSSFLFGFFNTFDKSPTYRSTGPFVLLNNSNARAITFNQSATDTLVLSDGSFASAAYWQWILQGAGTASLSRVQFFRYNQFTAAHGVYTDCIWDGGQSTVDVTTATNIVRGTVRNGTNGIKILGAAGSYPNLNITFSNQSTYDIQVGSGGAGTYNLSNISVFAGYTLKIRNDSATNAVTVAIPAGITYTTSTAGGAIAVSTPPTYQSVAISGLVAGSRVQIYDTTSSTELFNGIVAGTSTTWTDAVAAVASRAIRVRIAKVAGVTAYNFLEANIGTCGTGTSNAALSYLSNQTLDAVYNTNAVDGSTVTNITIDDSTDRVRINIPGGSVSWASIYAYQCYWNFTAAGIIDDGAIITSTDPANYTLWVFKIKNTSATVPLKITGGYGVDQTGNADIYDATGFTIIPVVAHVVGYATGSGPLTASQQTQLAAAANAGNLTISGGIVQANAVRFAGNLLYGTGVSGDQIRATP